jgi:hypothetical protein
MLIRPYLPIIYGVILLIVIYFFVKMIYSVYYTPGETVIYNSPYAQKLFPTATNKLFPTWGYNNAGMYNNKPFKQGQGGFWPESGKGYVPNRFGSPGPSPSGGMRQSFNIPAETEVGFWGNAPSQPIHHIRNIYDNSSQHVRYITPVVWWNK